MSRVTTPGMLMMERAIPERYRDGLGQLDEKALRRLATRVAKETPDLYSDFIGGVSDVSREVVYRHGNEASVGLEDLSLPPALRKYRDGIRNKVKAIANGPGTSKDKRAAIVKLLSEEITHVPAMILKEMADSGNGLVTQVLAGARGNPSQLMQVLFGDVLVVDAQDRPVPIPGLHGYGGGVTPLEYWAACSGARKGSVSAQFSTAQGGYLGKQMSNTGHRIVVTQRDCGTTKGLPVKGDDPDNVGAVLSSPAGGHEAGEVITEEMLDDLGDKPIRVRSVTSCEAEEGACALCSGIREGGGFPPIGAHVGIVATRAISEPVTQSGLKARHTGGVAGSDDKKVSGFKEMNQFVQVPRNFLGAATLATVDGRVTNVKPAGAGGTYVYVNSEEHYVPRGVVVTARPGDQVFAGDTLSEGVPNPAEVAEHKGIGEGRRYFVDKYREILRRNGASVNRRNIEALARGFVNRVRITEPEGYHGYIHGDIVPYDQFAKGYAPRKGSVDTPLAFAAGKWMERPYLHYTIGTRITPHVLKDLKAEGVASVMASDRPPVFKPHVVRTRELLATDPDWMTRLSGEGLKRSLLESARMGATSTPAGTSYFPAVADPSRLDKYKGGRSPLDPPPTDYMQVD